MKSAVVVLTLLFLILFFQFVVVRVGVCIGLRRRMYRSLSDYGITSDFFSLIYGVLVKGRLSFNNRQDVSAFFAFQETG